MRLRYRYLITLQSLVINQSELCKGTTHKPLLSTNNVLVYAVKWYINGQLTDISDIWVNSEIEDQANVHLEIKSYWLGSIRNHWVDSLNIVI